MYFVICYTHVGELVFKTGHAADLLKLNSYQQQQPIHQQQRQPQFDSCRDDPRSAALLTGSQPVGGPSSSPTQLAEFVKLLSNPVGAYIRDQAIKPNFSNQMSKVKVIDETFSCIDFWNGYD